MDKVVGRMVGPFLKNKEVDLFAEVIRVVRLGGRDKRDGICSD